MRANDTNDTNKDADLRPIKKISYNCLLPVLIFFVSIGLSLAIDYGISSGIFYSWKSMADAPEDAISFSSIYPGLDWEETVVVVKTESNKYYSCCSPNLRGPAWTEIQPIEDDQDWSCEEVRSHTNVTNSIFDKLPGEVMDCALVLWSWEWVADEDYYAIVKGNGVWKFHYRSGVEITLRLLGIGSVLGILLASVTAIVAHRRASNS